jgi:hypothetical protein
LAGLVAPCGSIGVTAYGQSGRPGVYHVQKMLRIDGTGQADGEPDDVKATQALLYAFPSINWHKILPRPAIHRMSRSPTGISFVGSAFTVSAFEDLATGVGLRIAVFVPPLL